jgi:hypothetical protein
MTLPTIVSFWLLSLCNSLALEDCPWYSLLLYSTSVWDATQRGIALPYPGFFPVYVIPYCSSLDSKLGIRQTLLYVQFKRHWFTQLLHCALSSFVVYVMNPSKVKLFLLQNRLYHSIPCYPCETENLLLWLFNFKQWYHQMYLNLRALLYTCNFDVRPITELMVRRILLLRC